jgi:hypothetical protein
MLSALIALMAAGAVAAFIFVETRDNRVASPAPGAGNPLQTTPTHG